MWWTANIDQLLTESWRLFTDLCMGYFANREHSLYRCNSESSVFSCNVSGLVFLLCLGSVLWISQRFAETLSLLKSSIYVNRQDSCCSSRSQVWCWWCAMLKCFWSWISTLNTKQFSTVWAGRICNTRSLCVFRPSVTADGPLLASWWNSPFIILKLIPQCVHHFTASVSGYFYSAGLFWCSASFGAAIAANLQCQATWWSGG